MKKIVNLLPVALALLALASCSNDDLTAQNAGEIQLKPNEILVKAEALGDGESSTMRAGFVEDEITVGSRTGLSFATLFNNGDVMKIYDDSKDWRPQDWTCTSTNDVQYAIETGAAGGDEAVLPHLKVQLSILLAMVSILLSMAHLLRDLVSSLTRIVLR